MVSGHGPGTDCKKILAIIWIYLTTQSHTLFTVKGGINHTLFTVKGGRSHTLSTVKGAGSVIHYS